MLDDAVDYLRRELRDHLGLGNSEVIIDSASTLIEDNNQQGAYISLVNVEEERSLRNMPHVERVGGQLQRREPPVHLNLYLLFAFEFTNYATSLLHLGNTIELFQKKRYFDVGNQNQANPFPAGLERLIVEMHNMTFEQLNHLWGVLGGSYFPSVVYRVRLVKVHAADTVPATEITTVEMETALT